MSSSRLLTNSFIFAIIVTLWSCSASVQTLEKAENGQLILCTDIGCVELFGDELVHAGSLLPPLDLASFHMLKVNSHITHVFTTSIEPHFSGLTLETTCDNCSDAEMNSYLANNRAVNLEMHRLEGKESPLWVANYQCRSAKFGALAYFRELIYIDGDRAIRYVFWTFDHPHTLKSETIRIFDTFFQMKEENK
jgi:hypothetical protein